MQIVRFSKNFVKQISIFQWSIFLFISIAYFSRFIFVIIQFAASQRVLSTFVVNGTECSIRIGIS